MKLFFSRLTEILHKSLNIIQYSLQDEMHQSARGALYGALLPVVCSEMHYSIRKEYVSTTSPSSGLQYMLSQFVRNYVSTTSASSGLQ